MIVVDASVVLEVLLRTEAAEALEERMLNPAESMCAPHLLDIEVAQVVRRYCLLGETTSERGAEALRDLADMAIERFPHAPFLPRIWQLRQNLTAYDAAYVALAETLGCTLLTRDQALAKSPIHTASVEVL
jgi:predicted nucleic acid-binding protein